MVAANGWRTTHERSDRCQAQPFWTDFVLHSRQTRADRRINAATSQKVRAMTAADILVLTVAIIGVIDVWRERIDDRATERARFNMMGDCK